MSLTAERLRELVTYDAETGVMRWRVARGAAVAGGAVGCKMKDGYRVGIVDGHRAHVHRFAWLYVHGEFPAKQIDHINGVRDDNRIANLRLATPTQQQGNQKLRKNNSSGHPGVCWRSRQGRWQAEILIGRRKKHLGYFVEKEDAALAYRRAAEAYFGAFAAHISRPAP